MKQLIIAVTNTDIDQGIPNDCENCPIAIALLRRGYLDVSVGYEYILTKHSVIPVSFKMEQWMTLFDSHQIVKPTAFFVDAEAL